MIDIFYTFCEAESEEYIKFVLRKYYNILNPTICKTINGKPYIKGGKIHFNLSHSKGLTALAVGKKQVGFDCENLAGKARPAVLKIFRTRKSRNPLHLRFLCALDGSRKLYQIPRRNPRSLLAESRIRRRENLLQRRRCAHKYFALRNRKHGIQRLRRLPEIQFEIHRQNLIR